MREIKFRVFDIASSYNPMHIVGEDNHDSFWIDSNNKFHYRNLQNGESSGENGDYILMQYTGLKDKNGKEIYEGDIILWKDKSPMSDGTLNEIVEVFWSDEFLKWSIKGNLNNAKTYIADLYDYSNTEEIEIIGNIYVNKELLRNENK